MKHLLSGAIGAMLGAILLWMWWPGAGCSEERATITALSERNAAAQWEAKLSQHRLSKTQRELGAQLAQRVGKIDDVMKVDIKDVKVMPCQAGQAWTIGYLSGCDEVASITALAKSLTAMEAEARKRTELIDTNPAPRSWWHQVKPTLFRLAAGRW